MTRIRFKQLLCLGHIGANGENFLNRDGSLELEPAIELYFYQKYKDKPGSVLFFNTTGGLVVKQLKDLTFPEMCYFGVI